MPTPAEIRTAPSKMLRIVHTDPRDHQPTSLGDFTGINEACVLLRTKTSMELLEITVHNDQGLLVPIQL
jgi:hypothetical protein